LRRLSLHPPFFLGGTLCSFERELCPRLPLADVVFRLLDFCTADDFLDDIFDRDRGRSYQESSPSRSSSRSSRTRSADANARHQNFQQAHAHGTLPTWVEALYGKRRRVPLPLSQGLLGEATCRLRQVFPDVPDPLPAAWTIWKCSPWTASKSNSSPKRLSSCVCGAANPGGNPRGPARRHGLAVAIEAAADGEAADNGLVAGALAPVRQRTAGKPRLWVGDRSLAISSSSGPPGGRRSRLAALPVQGPFSTARRSGRSRPGSMGVACPPPRRGLAGSTRQPASAIRAPSPAPRARGSHPAGDGAARRHGLSRGRFAETYLRRWGIEKLFQRGTEVFDLRHLIGSTPQAPVFQAAFCFLLSKVSQTVRGYVAAAQACEPETISTPLLFEDVADELTAWHKLCRCGHAGVVAGRRDVAGAGKGVPAGALAGTWKERCAKRRRRSRRRRNRRHGISKAGIARSIGFNAACMKSVPIRLK